MRLFATAVKTIMLSGMIASLTLAQPQRPDSKNLRECASCHFQWMEAFEQPQGILLIEKPSKPMEAESNVCLSCHDGSVVDSRRQVWVEHGHKKDVVPPPEMTVPEILPLQDGKIVCRTCHSAHLSDAPVDLENPIFLRVPNDKSQLCHLCHQDKIPGQGHSEMHLLAKMSEPIPEELVKAGARSHIDQREVHCMVCHTPHGSKEDHLLVLGADNNQLCLACHEKQRPGMWHEQKGLHPDQPFVTQAHQINAIKDIGTRLSPDNRLICLSCHRMHDGQSGRFMLALPLENSTFCIRCHPKHQEILETKHDPREYATDEKNLQDLSIEQAGPCSSCHMFHSLAQLPNPKDYDASGMCMNCHEDIHWDLSLEQQPLKSVMHPHSVLESTDKTLASKERMGCHSCHDIHTHLDSPHLLRIESQAKPVELCYSCHPNNRSLETSMHRHSALAAAQVDNTGSSPCGPCHTAHATQNSSSHMLWALELDHSDKPLSEKRCMACHKENGEAQLPAIFEHPEPKLLEGALQLYSNSFASDDPIRQLNQISCMTCHLSHGRSLDEKTLKNGVDDLELSEIRSYKTMLRPNIAQQLCSQCHGFDAAMLFLYYHRIE